MIPKSILALIWFIIFFMGVMVWKAAYSAEIPKAPAITEMESWHPDEEQVLGVIVTYIIGDEVVQFAYPIQSTGLSGNCEEVVVNDDHVTLTVTPIGYIISPDPTMYRIGVGEDWQSVIEKTYRKIGVCPDYDFVKRKCRK